MCVFVLCEYIYIYITSHSTNTHTHASACAQTASAHALNVTGISERQGVGARKKEDIFRSVVVVLFVEASLSSSLKAGGLNVTHARRKTSPLKINRQKGRK